MIDAFLFFNESDLLEIRLNSLKPYIRKFVIAEATQTFSGKPKPLNFDKNRYKDFNIEYLIVPPSDLVNDEFENHSRKYLVDNLGDGDLEEIVLISDLDEIPDLSTYKGQEGIFRLPLYYYYLNCFTGLYLNVVFAKKRKNLCRYEYEVKWRKMFKKRKPIVGTGWHFSTLGSTKDIEYKIESSSHTNLNTDEIKNRIELSKENLKDLYKPSRQYIKQEPSGPEWLLKNKEKYDLWLR
jgi:beta-1,4-mannosyl-glycoprotein beta-1,4-N-acetylglucosaminyltransferase